MNGTPRANAAVGAKLLLLLAITAGLAWALYTHRFRLNDQRYMVWSWRHLPPANIYPAAVLLSIPFFLGQWIYARLPRARMIALGLVMGSAFLLMIAFLAVQWVPPDFGAIGYAVNNLPNGGYLAEGLKFKNSGLTAVQILERYPRILPGLFGHTYNKPPGFGLLCMWIIGRLGAEPGTSELVGIVIALAAMLAVPASYAFIAHFTGDRDAGFCGASFLALCPSMLLFYPTTDQLFPAVSVLLAILWSLALTKNKIAFSAAFGVALGITLFFSYLPAVLILLFLGIALLRSRLEPRCTVRRIAVHAGVAVGCFVLLYLILWLGTGFDPVATFETAWRTEHLRMARWTADTGLPPRRLPGTIPWDLYSFAMGVGWIGILAAIYYFLSAPSRTEGRGQFWFSLLCVGQLLIVALTGLFPGETIRLWIFMLPLLMAPIGLELSRWGRGAKITVYAALLVITIVLCQSMVFIV